MESASSGRTWAAARRGILWGPSLLLLHAVLGATLLAIAHTSCVQRPAHDLVAHTRQVLDTTASHQHHGVLLQVVALARDVGRDLDRARDAHAGDLAQGGVRLLRGRRVNACADAASLWS